MKESSAADRLRTLLREVTTGYPVGQPEMERLLGRARRRRHARRTLTALAAAAIVVAFVGTTTVVIRSQLKSHESLVPAGPAASMGASKSPSAGSAASPTPSSAPSPSPSPTPSPNSTAWPPGSLPVQVVAVASPSIVTKGQQVTFSFILTANSGPVSGVVLKFSAVGDWWHWSSYCSGAGPNFTCNIGSIVPGQPARVWITEIVTQPASPMTQDASISGLSNGQRFTSTAAASATVH